MAYEKENIKKVKELLEEDWMVCVSYSKDILDDEDIYCYKGSNYEVFEISEDLKTFRAYVENGFILEDSTQDKDLNGFVWTWM